MRKLPKIYNLKDFLLILTMISIYLIMRSSLKGLCKRIEESCERICRVWGWNRSNVSIDWFRQFLYL